MSTGAGPSSRVQQHEAAGHSGSNGATPSPTPPVTTEATPPPPATTAPVKEARETKPNQTLSAPQPNGYRRSWQRSH